MSDVEHVKTLDQRDTELHIAFVDAYFEDVSILEDIPNGSTLVRLPEDDPELAERNLQIGIRAARKGADVYIRHFPRTGPSQNVTSL